MESHSYQNETTIKKCGFISSRPPAHLMNDRSIISNVPDLAVPNNMITTSKYSSIITFIPLNLMEQFQKLANVYFLVIAIMQMITAISITNGQPVIMGPLSVVVSISMIKDFIEDYQRRTSDSVENNRKSYLLSTEYGGKNVSWQDIRIGDIIKVQKDEQIPADIVLMKTSDKKGNAFIETKNLDGETNLKNKSVHKNLKQLQEQTEDSLVALRMSVKYERPNPYLYKFTGSAEINNQQIPLDEKNFILRGCVLRNVDYIYGLVCYNGHDSKIMLNSIKAQPKRSHLENTMNIFILVIFLLQMVMCAFAGYQNSKWQFAHNDELTYLDILANGPEHNFIKNLFIKWGNWILIFTNFVPISLLVSLEMVKYFQGMLITRDEGTYSAEYDIKTVVQSSNLNEELGQVDYIFSDKTGTLTKNQMDFKCLTVNKKAYGKEQTMTNDEVGKLAKVTNVDFRDKQFFADLHSSTGKGPIHEFLLCLSICHTVITETKSSQLQYQASSPDELALVNFARYCGYTFEGIDTSNSIVINVQGENKQYQLLQVLEFNSTRKRVSVIVQDPQNHIIMYTKGADSVIEPLMKPVVPQLKQKTWSDLQEFATIGLRTLLLTKRIIPLNIYQNWEKKYTSACSAIQNREEQMMIVQAEIEQELELIGGTAIEDKLQEEVGATIQYLKDAGIKVWVLTGDKIETAINIGYSCQLLNDSLKQLIVDGREEQEISNALDQALKESSILGKYALIISGDALIQAMKPQYSSKVMQIAEKCEAVVACRVSPKQKQEIVSLVRTNKPKVTTLAIGDGANDVNMITAAHIGIGIKGVEGQQAARASDYAVGEFRILRRLTLYHGRESYRKNSTLVNYNFYKNMLLVLPQYWWAIANGFSAVMFYDQWLYQSYNLFFTSLPIVIYAIFDEEFSGDILIQNPKLYELGLFHQLFNVKQFLLWLLSGTIQAGIESLLAFQTFEDVSIKDGLNAGLWTTGSLIIGYSVLNSNIKIILFSNTFSVGVMIGLIGSILSYVLMFYFISDVMSTADASNSWVASFARLKFYAITFLIVASTSLIDLGFTRWNKFSQYSEMNLQHQHDKVYMPIQKQHIEFKDEQQNTTQIQMANVQPPKSPKSFRRGYTGFAFSQEEH